jgi:hypothetical protein
MLINGAGALAGMTGWQAEAWLQLSLRADGSGTMHQGGATAPLKWQRGFPQGGGRLGLPLLHTAGGLVGGDGLAVRIGLDAGGVLIAPVTIGEGGTVGGGSTISKSTPAGQLTVARGKQVSIAGWTRPVKPPKGG